jgi:hypothetical protein
MARYDSIGACRARAGQRESPAQSQTTENNRVHHGLLEIVNARMADDRQKGTPIVDANPSFPICSGDSGA